MALWEMMHTKLKDNGLGHRDKDIEDNMLRKYGNKRLHGWEFCYLGAYRGRYQDQQIMTFL